MECKEKLMKEKVNIKNKKLLSNFLIERYKVRSITTNDVDLNEIKLFEGGLEFAKTLPEKYKDVY